MSTYTPTLQCSCFRSVLLWALFYYLYSFTLAGIVPLSEIPTRALGSLLVRCFVFRTQITAGSAGWHWIPRGHRWFPSLLHPLDIQGVERDSLLCATFSLYFMLDQMLYYTDFVLSFVLYCGTFTFVVPDLYSFFCSTDVNMYSDSRLFTFQLACIFRTLMLQLSVVNSALKMYFISISVMYFLWIVVLFPYYCCSGWHVYCFTPPYLCWRCCTHDNDVPPPFTGHGASLLVSELQVHTRWTGF